MFGTWDWVIQQDFTRQTIMFCRESKISINVPHPKHIDIERCRCSSVGPVQFSIQKLRVDKQHTHFGQKLCSMKPPTLPNLFCMSIKLITGSKFRDIFLGDSRDIFLAARHFPCLISSSCFKL